MTEQSKRKSVDLDAILGKSAGTLPTLTSEERRGLAVETAHDRITDAGDDPYALDGEQAFSRLVEHYKNGELNDPQVIRWFEEISTAQFKKFRRDYNKRYGTEGTKFDDLRSAAIEFAAEMVDRESATAESAREALEAAHDDDDDMTEHAKLFVTRASERQWVKFGRDWRREQDDPQREGGPRRNRFDELDAKIDELKATVETLTAHIERLTEQSS